MHAIPAPRTAHPNRMNGTLSGTSCPTCAHRTCRTHRAQSLPRLGGHRSEFVAEHHGAAALQARHPGLVIFFGESTQSYWIATPAGLTEARTWDELLALLWSRPNRGQRT